MYGVAVINPPKDAWDITVSIDKWDGPAFLCKRQKLLQAQRKNGDPGFDYFKKELTLKEYEVQTRKEEAKLLKTLPRQFDLKNERDVETMFLDTIARQAGNQSVVYGNDVEGTLLDHDEKMRDNSWCPMKIALEPNCPIRALGDDCPGITRPYMYFGMLFTFFAWHTEDNDLYSINYMVRFAAMSLFPSLHRQCSSANARRQQQLRHGLAALREGEDLVCCPRSRRGRLREGGSHAEHPVFAPSPPHR